MWLWGDRLVTVNLMANTFLTLQPGSAILSETGPCEILVPMERRSLLVLSKDARYKWMHSIKKEHIVDQRWAITLREASDEYRVHFPMYDNLLVLFIRVYFLFLRPESWDLK